MKISEKLPSRLELVSEFITQILEKVKDCSLNEHERFNVKLCMEEALVNAMKHGNKLDPNLSVKIDVECNPKALEIQIENEGEGFDHKGVADPTLEDNLRKLSGRGIFLIKKQMDKVEFFDNGRGIKMTKFLNQGGTCEH